MGDILFCGADTHALLCGADIREREGLASLRVDCIVSSSPRMWVKVGSSSGLQSNNRSVSSHGERKIVVHETLAP
jgi:hypothetical protein